MAKRQMSCEQAKSMLGPTKAAPAWTGTKQRDDLKPCPFCGTKAVQQVRLANSDTDMNWRIGCGNSFCEVEPNTQPSASLHSVEIAWETREGGSVEK